jgi:hypothetical protein
MALWEYKKLEIAPDSEIATRELLERYGWILDTSQEVLNTDSHLERKGDTIYNVTEKTHFVKLVFKRDKSSPHYAEWVELEKVESEIGIVNSEINALTKPVFFKASKIGILPILVIALGLVYFFSSLGNMAGVSPKDILIYGIAPVFILIAIGVVLILLRIRSYPKRASKRIASFDKDKADYDSKREALLKRQSTLSERRKALCAAITE